MAAAIALGGFTGPEADTLGYAIRKKKSSVLRAQKEKFVTRAAERGVAAAVDRPGVRGVRAVRALRLQQGPRHVLRPDRLPDRLPQGELHGRLHGLASSRRSGTTRRRSRRRSPSAAAWASRSGRRTSAGARSSSRSRTRRIRFGLLAVKNVGQGAIESIIAAREAEGPFKSLGDLCRRIDLRLANRKVLESLAKVGALQRVRAPGAGPRGPRRRDRRGRRHAARPRHGPDVAVRRRRGGVDGPGAAAPERRSRRRSASGSAGRRSSSACTCPSTRWARSPTRSASS